MCSPGINYSFGKIFPKNNWRIVGDFSHYGAGNPDVSERHSRIARFECQEWQFCFWEKIPKKGG
jgi:hypothetical protein